MLCPRMQRKVKDVRAYIANSPAERQPALKRLRSLCNGVLKGYSEEIDYGMPVYKRNGAAEVAFASQKQYISLYVLKTDVVNAHRDALSGCSVGKGCIRFRRPEQIDFDVVRSLLRGTVKSSAQPCVD
jgi:uncharacterized protein YdhG (YjbR/CyaY superfamily)